uniref:C-type lectin domain-containing protein n=1 Tax=Nothobranchius furzeri TaxID=105023 RepID=A0A8C6P4D6_NOTFU
MRNIWVFVFVLLILPPVCGQQSGLRFVQLTYYSMIGTWEEAQSFCRSRNTDLVTIRSDLENQIDFGFDYWIGLYRDNVTVPWKWSRGNETATFFNWARYASLLDTSSIVKNKCLKKSMIHVFTVFIEYFIAVLSHSGPQKSLSCMV